MLKNELMELQARLDEWEKLAEDDEHKNICIRCGSTMECGCGYEKTPTCNDCAHEITEAAIREAKK